MGRNGQESLCIMWHEHREAIIQIRQGTSIVLIELERVPQLIASLARLHQAAIDNEPTFFEGNETCINDPTDQSATTASAKLDNEDTHGKATASNRA